MRGCCHVSVRLRRSIKRSYAAACETRPAGQRSALQTRPALVLLDNAARAACTRPPLHGTEPLRGGKVYHRHVAMSPTLPISGWRVPLNAAATMSSSATTTDQWQVVDDENEKDQDSNACCSDNVVTAALPSLSLHFDNRALRVLPVDQGETFQRQVAGAVYSRLEPLPAPLKNPVLVAVSRPALKLIGLEGKHLDALLKGLENQKAFAEWFSLSRSMEGMDIAAACYCGFQFGYFSGQLGDGAAVYAGEIIGKSDSDHGNGIAGKGEQQRWEMNFKGVGPTPYSRSSDGRKVLRSSIREFLCSEAMHALHIPTTRAATIVTSDSTVMRDAQYSGNAAPERCTVVLRLAHSFLRFGSFEVFRPKDPATGRAGGSAEWKTEADRTAMLRTMVEYVIRNFYPSIWKKHTDGVNVNGNGAAGATTACVRDFFQEVVRRTACLVAKWQSVGFCHGVLNTDNMSILGDTMDYGPYRFMDYTDLDLISNGSDHDGRYSYRQQPSVCKWNCERLAEALRPLLPPSDAAPILNAFDGIFYDHYMSLMLEKLGFDASESAAGPFSAATLTGIPEGYVSDALLAPPVGDDQLFAMKQRYSYVVHSLVNTMHKTRSDWTNTFRALVDVALDPSLSGDSAEVKVGEMSQDIEALAKRIAQNVCMPLETLKGVFKANIAPEMLARYEQLLILHPKAKGLIIKELENAKKREELNGLTQNDLEKLNMALWVDWLVSYRDLVNDSSACLSFGGGGDGAGDGGGGGASQSVYLQRRRSRMENSNPQLVLRNHLAQHAIEAAEKGDFSEVQNLLHALQDPFAPPSAAYTQTVPACASDLRVTCSS